ncbi:LsmAD domain-containing protein/PAM2 domain-containing protein/SM-ATX domain-containing protein, partial [Cephalotus follicularis]
MMNLQQVAPSKSSANGFGRRRVEREVGTKQDNKLQFGKSNSGRVSNAGAPSGNRVGGIDSLSRDRLTYVSTCLIGQPVEVQAKDGSIYTGIFHAADPNNFGIILKMARMTKDGTLRGQKSTTESVTKAPIKTFIIPANDLVQVIAKDVAVTRDGFSDEFQQEKQQDIMLDSFISQSRHAEMERELEPWVPDEDDPHCPELENIFEGHWNRNWDQFETNETLFGVKSTFDEELYTTKLEKGPRMRDLEREAMRIAREIEGEETQDLHLAEERGIHRDENFDMDEETRFSSVFRGIDDSGYEENEDILLDFRNVEAFGASSDYVGKRLSGLTSGKSNDRARDEVHSSQSDTAVDLYHSGSYDHARQLASEHGNESKAQVNMLGESGGNNDAKLFIEKQMLADDAKLSKSGDSQLSLDGKMDGSDKGGLSANATAYAPSHVASKGNEKATSSGESLDSPVSAKARGETQSVNSRGRPGSSTSSGSDCVAAASASGGPGLSPSSSVGSLSSEKSSRNPHAKEFKLNPNAKSFTPSQTPVRPQSPVSDASFYYPNMSAVQHMHGMPVGFGIGPSFAGHQPVIFNPQIAPMQTSQPYFHPNGPQYGQQMLLGQPRQVMYMPSYPP